MAASVGPDSGHYIGQQVLIDRFLCSRQCRVKVPLLNGPDQCGGTAGALDGVLVGQKAHVVLKNRRARTVPLIAAVVPIIERWAAGKSPSEWLFHAPEGGPLREANWKRSVRWREAVAAIGHPTLRVHDLRHTAASVWLGSGADPKVVQRVLGHGSAAMTMYGPLRAPHRSELVVSRRQTWGHLGDTHWR
jgi:integrase